MVKQIRRNTPLTITGIALLLLASMLLSACARDPLRYIERGKEYFDAQKYSEAAIEFMNASKINPNLAEAHYQLGRTFMALGAFARGFPGCQPASGPT